MLKIRNVRGREIIDSRGNPTVEAQVTAGDVTARAAVPSGASVGIYEAHELRDHGKAYHGLGVSKAAVNIGIIGKRIRGMDAMEQEKVDSAMIALDGTMNKRRLGANAILAVSLAVSRAAAGANPLYRHLTKLTKKKPVLPVPFCNIINGGRHAGTSLKMQEFMIAPLGERSFRDATRAVCETYHVLKSIIEKKFGKPATNVGDEGGFAPQLGSAGEALELIQGAIEEAGYQRTMCIAVDAAASEFYRAGRYRLKKSLTGRQLLEYYIGLAREYRIVSIEDPFDQDDHEPWAKLTSKAGFQVVGDDLLATNPSRIGIAQQKRLCNALLLKLNQIGTLTEALEAARLAGSCGWQVMVSHRSGETEDAYNSHLAAALSCGQIKIGAPCRGERTAKFNELLRIEEGLGSRAAYARNCIPR